MTLPTYQPKSDHSDANEIADEPNQLALIELAEQRDRNDQRLRLLSNQLQLWIDDSIRRCLDRR
jgi:hypothetical protein